MPIEYPKTNFAFHTIKIQFEMVTKMLWVVTARHGNNSSPTGNLEYRSNSYCEVRDTVFVLDYDIIIKELQGLSQAEALNRACQKWACSTRYLLLYIGSLEFLCLPQLIRDTLWGVGARILKIICIEAELWAKQKFKTEFFLHTL